MFGSIGMPELIIILVIALIIFGPRKLPELGRSLGRSIGEFKRASNELRNTLEEEIRVEEQRDQRAAIRAEQDSAVEAAAPPAPAPSTPTRLRRRTKRSTARPAPAPWPSGPDPVSEERAGPMPDDDLVEGRDDLETAADDEMGGKMSFLDHLDELRRRIIYAVLSVGIGFVIAFFFIDDIFNFVMRPMQQLLPGGTLVYTDPTEAFMLYIKIALISGLLLASPGGSRRSGCLSHPASMHEKKWAIPFVLMSSFFHPRGVVFTRGRLSDHLALLRRFHERHRHVHAADRAGILDLSRLILALGITFQLPTLVLFLARMGMITPRFMIRTFACRAAHHHRSSRAVSRWRRRGLIAMGGPVVLLYVFSIGLAWRSAERSATPTRPRPAARPSACA